jgi:hypothetical protein
MRYTIKYISALSAFKFGSVVGTAVGFPPGLFLGLLLRYVIHTVRVWLESWLRISIPVVGDISLLDATSLSSFLTSLQRLDDRSFLLVLTITLAVMIIGGLLIGLLAALGAAVYNLVAGISGGLEIKAEALNATALPALSAASAMPIPSPGGLPAPIPMQAVHSSAYPPGPFSSPPSHKPDLPPSPADFAGNWLVGTASQQRWPVAMGLTRIGSAISNHIVVDGMAANHAEIRWENGRHVLYDLSGGQSWVNGRQINGANMLKPGFQLRLGNCDFLFQ